MNRKAHLGLDGRAALICLTSLFAACSSSQSRVDEGPRPSHDAGDAVEDGSTGSDADVADASDAPDTGAAPRPDAGPPADAGEVDAGAPDAGEPPADAPFFTYLGGSGNGRVSFGAIRDVAFDGEGNVYAVGGISHDGYGTPGAAVPRYQGGDADAFVASFAPSGALRFFTYLGGPNHDRAYGVEIHPSGIYVSGRAGPGLPTTPGVVQPDFGGDDQGATHEYGPQDGFLARLSLDGRRWDWVTYFGGPGHAVVRDVDVDAAGNVWGALIELDQPIPIVSQAPAGFDRTYAGGREGAVVKLSPDGRRVLFAAYVGGSGDEVGAASVRTVADGGAYFVMSTTSDDPPVTAGAYRTRRGGASDVLLLRLSAEGALLAGTVYGGGGEEGGETHNLTVAEDGTPVVAMFSTSPSLPDTLNAAPGGGGSSFAVRFSEDLGRVLAARWVGGSDVDEIEGVAAYGGRIAVTGGTRSGDFPITPNAPYPSRGGDFDGFVTLMTLDMRTLELSTFIPGGAYDWVNGVAFGPNGQLGFGGNTQSLNLPTTPGAYEGQPNPNVPRVGGRIRDNYDAGWLVLIPSP